MIATLLYSLMTDVFDNGASQTVDILDANQLVFIALCII